MSARLLLIEDEPGIVLTLTDRLASEGYVVENARDGEAGLERAARERFDLIVLDVGLPKKSGFDVCRDLRQRGVDTPVIMLTARGQVVDKVVGLKLGADDYVTKPFEMAELLARIEARLRRSRDDAADASSAARQAPRDATGDVWTCGPVQIDLRAAEVRCNGRNVELSAKEFQLLKYFVAHRGATLSRDELLNEVWGYHSMPSTRTVDVHVAWLRQKLEENPRRPKLILTMHGLGYKFVA